MTDKNRTKSLKLIKFSISQNKGWQIFKHKELSKSKAQFSSTPNVCFQKRPQREWDTIKILVWDLRLQKKPAKAHILIKNAHSPETYLLEEKSWKVSLCPQRWQELSSSEEITCTTSRNITDSRKDTETFQFTAPQLFQQKKVISLLLDNADLCQRLWDSTSCKCTNKRTRAPARGNSLFSKYVWLF